MTPPGNISATEPAPATSDLALENARLRAQVQRLGDALAQAQQKQSQMENILNHLPMMVGYWDQNQINRFANRAYMDWFGLDPSQILNRNMREVLGDTLYALNRPHVEAALRGEEQQFERVVPNPVEGRSRHSLAHYLPDTFDGHTRGFFVLVTDVSQLKETELVLRKSRQILRESEDRYRTVVMDQTELISRLRADGTYLFANDVFCRFFGKDIGDLMGSTWQPLVFAQDKERVARELQQLSPSNPVVMIENRVLSGTGEMFWMQFSNRGFFSEQGELLQIQSVGRDITQRKQTETELLKLNAELTASHRQLREMAAQNETRIENERKHFSREVHDELGQILTALRMDILVLEMKFCASNSALEDKVQDMKGLVDQAIQGVRNVAANLRPTALDMGLIDALKWLCSEFSRKSGVACNFVCAEPVVRLDEEKAIVLFRIVQESLTNITRYAQAASVQVLVQRSGEALSVCVRDDGIGFDANATLGGHSYGLLGMRERALALGGHVDIESGPGAGTSVLVSIPLLEVGESAP